MHQVPLAHLQPQQAAAEMAYRDLRPPLPSPAECPPALTALLQECWAGDPAQRPLFPDILRRLDQLVGLMEAQAAMAQFAIRP
jgi:hypothetical protein